MSLIQASHSLVSPSRLPKDCPPKQVTPLAHSYDGVTNELPYSYEGYQHPQQVATYPTTNSVAANAYQKR